MSRELSFTIPDVATRVSFKSEAGDVLVEDDLWRLDDLIGIAQDQNGQPNTRQGYWIPRFLNLLKTNHPSADSLTETEAMYIAVLVHKQTEEFKKKLDHWSASPPSTGSTPSDSTPASNGHSRKASRKRKRSKS